LDNADHVPQTDQSLSTVTDFMNINEIGQPTGYGPQSGRYLHTTCT